MGLLKKKQLTITELKRPVEECSFTYNNPKLLRRHIDWKHPELTKSTVKVK